MKKLLGIFVGCGLLSSLTSASEFIYNETILEKELRQKIACLSDGSCTPDISGYFEEGNASNPQLIDGFVEVKKEKLVSSIQLNVNLDVNSASHHFYEGCKSLDKVIKNELLKDSDIPLTRIRCNSALGFTSGSHSNPLAPKYSTLGKQQCKNDICPSSFFNGTDFFKTNDFFPFEITANYTATATPIKLLDSKVVFNVEITANYQADTFNGEIRLINDVSQAAKNGIYSQIADNFTGSFTSYDNWQVWEAPVSSIGAVSVAETSFSSCSDAVEKLKEQNASLFENVTGYECENSSTDVINLPGGSGEFNSVNVAPVVGHQLCKDNNCPPGKENGQKFDVLVDTIKIITLKVNEQSNTNAPLTVGYRTIYRVRPADFNTDYQLMVASLPLNNFFKFKSELGNNFEFSGKKNSPWGGNYSVKTRLSGGQTISTSPNSSPMILGCNSLQIKKDMSNNSGTISLKSDDISQLLSSCDQIKGSAPYAQSLSSDIVSASWTVSAINLTDEIDIWQRYADVLTDNIELHYSLYSDFKRLQDINYNDTAVVAGHMKSLSDGIWSKLKLFLLISRGMSPSQINNEYNTLFFQSGDLTGILKYSTGEADAPEYWREFVSSGFGKEILNKESAIRALNAALIDDNSDQTATREIFLTITSKSRDQLMNEVNKANWFLVEYVAAAQGSIKDELINIQNTLQENLNSLEL